MILLDTDTCVSMLRGNKAALARKVEAGDMARISAMTAAELYYGAEKSSKPEINRAKARDFIFTIPVIEINLSIAFKFGQLKAALAKSGTTLPDADILVAATALVHGTLLVTGNTRHFSRFPDLAIANWLV